jgi:hypothetical protein
VANGGIDALAKAVVEMEGSLLLNSVNMGMVRDLGKWNVGHLIWAGQRGATSVWYKDRYWAGWSTQQESYEGLKRDLVAKANRGMTIAEAFRMYAPSFENNTANYIAFVSSRVGYPPDTPLSTAIAGGPYSPLPSGTVVLASNGAEPASGDYTGSGLLTIGDESGGAGDGSLNPAALAIIAGAAVLAIALG